MTNMATKYQTDSTTLWCDKIISLSASRQLLKPTSFGGWMKREELRSGFLWISDFSQLVPLGWLPLNIQNSQYNAEFP